MIFTLHHVACLWHVTTIVFQSEVYDTRYHAKYRCETYRESDRSGGVKWRPPNKLLLETYGKFTTTRTTDVRNKTPDTRVLLLSIIKTIPKNHPVHGIPMFRTANNIIFRSGAAPLYCFDSSTWYLPGDFSLLTIFPLTQNNL